MGLKTWTVVTLAASLWTGSASAEDSVSYTASDARFKEGLAALKAGNCERARVNFTQTLSLEPENGDVLVNLAVAENCTKNYLEGLRHLKQYFASPKANQDTDREITQKLYDKLWNATGHLKISADRGEAIVLDDAKLGSAPLADVVDVNVGSHRVTAGGRTVDVNVAGGETKNVDLASPESPTREKKPVRNTAGWIVPGAVGALGVVGLGVGVGFAISSKSAKDTENSLRATVPCVDASSAACGQLKDARNSVSNRATVSTVGYVAGGVLIVGAVATWFLWPQSKQTMGMKVSPVVGAGTGGLDFSGSF
ncbi:MAG: hypothetical protein FWD69_10590 [Polyangiaceae bacterium]|nr:hypothetical protein [Polyangiaceae bacterium]